MNNFAMEAEEGFVEEVTLMLSLRKTNGLLRDREDKKRHFPQRKQHEQRYKGMEMHSNEKLVCGQGRV